MQHDVRATYIPHPRDKCGFFWKIHPHCENNEVHIKLWWAHPVSTQEKEEMETVGSFAILILKSREQFIVW